MKKVSYNKSIFNKENLPLVLICFLIIISGLFAQNIITFPMYLFGVCFFFAGVFVGLYIKVFGLIFLFSHGGAGLFIMLSSITSIETENGISLEKFKNHPLFTDGGIPTNIKLYLAVTLGFLLSAIILTIIHNFSDKMKKDKKYACYVLLLYLLVIIHVMLFPRIFSYLYV